MEIYKDKAGNQYVEVDNIRVTYVAADNRNSDANWSGQDVFRIQAYRNSEDKSLHRGAEFPVESDSSLLNLIAGITSLRAENFKVKVGC